MHRTLSSEQPTVPISPIHADYKHGYSQPFLSCDCGAALDMNRTPGNKTKAGEAFRMAHEECLSKVERGVEVAQE